MYLPVYVITIINRRYFAALEEESSFKPGVVSDELRSALGLHRDKLPIWIYRMRVLGYPPGWLKVADMTKTVVPLIDGEQDSRNNSQSRINQEERTYNVDSLVTYPGFNAPVPEGVKDDWRLLRMPPMMKHQQLAVATATMKRPKPVPYKRVNISKATDLGEDKEMEDSMEESVNRIELLEKAKQEAEAKKLDPESSELEEGSRSRRITVGVPVPSSYLKPKPPLEKWSENNSLADLIYFENLPNSTGTFDKMRSVLGSVRAKLFSNNDDGARNMESKEDESNASQTSFEASTSQLVDSQVINISMTSNGDDESSSVAILDDNKSQEEIICISPSLASVEDEISTKANIQMEDGEINEVEDDIQIIE